MKIYHNSIYKVLNICFSKVQRGYLFLFDLSGECILKLSVHNQTNIRIPIKGVPPGEYILQVDNFYQKVFVG